MKSEDKILSLSSKQLSESAFKFEMSRDNCQKEHDERDSSDTVSGAHDLIINLYESIAATLRQAAYLREREELGISEQQDKKSCDDMLLELNKEMQGLGKWIDELDNEYGK